MKGYATKLGAAAAVLALVLGFGATPSYAISVTNDSNAASLLAALLGSTTGLSNITASVSGNAAQTGTFTNVSGTYSAFLGSGIVLSSGTATDYSDGPNTTISKTTNFGAPATPAQSALLTPISGPGSYFDVSEFSVSFDAPGASEIFFAVVFGSEEYPEWVNSSFIDGFGLYLNGVNIAFVGGQPVNINHPDFGPLAGTELDGVLAPGGNPFLVFNGLVNPTGNTLTFIVADKSDANYDTTAYLAAFGTTTPIPEPSTVLLLGAGLVGLYVGRKRMGA